MKNSTHLVNLFISLNDTTEWSLPKESLRNIWHSEIASVVELCNFSSSSVNNFCIILCIYFFSSSSFNGPKLKT